MKPLPNVELRVEASALAPLASYLTEVGYTEAAICQLLGIRCLSVMTAADLPLYIFRCRQVGSEFASAVLFFLLRQPVPGFKPPCQEEMKECGLVEELGGDLGCGVGVYPCLDRFFVTDLWVEGTQQGQVYELGTDSYAMARLLPRSKVGRSLDLCTGSGIHAILSSYQALDTLAVDINPRALQYTRLNAALNSTTCQGYLGDLYQPVEGRFDLITVNPPFVPSPDPEILVHRSPGTTGEEVAERLVAALPDRLAENGLFSMVLEYPIRTGDPYQERLQRWLGETHGWGIAVLSLGQKPLGPYIRDNIQGSPDYEVLFRSYLESYQKQGIEAMDFAKVFIMRLGPERPNFLETRALPWPIVDLREQVRDWLQALKTYRDPNWHPDPGWRPKLSRHYKALLRDWDLQRGLLEVADVHWLQAPPLNTEEAELLCRTREELTVEQLGAQWLKEGKSEAGFVEALRGLGLRVALS